MEQDRNGQKNSPARGAEASAAYSDAYYRAAPQERRSVYGYSPAECYAHASETDAPEPSLRRRSGVGPMVTLICAIVLLLVVLLASGGMLFNHQASAAGDSDSVSREILDEYAAAVDDEEPLLFSRGSAADAEPLSAEEIYTAACRFTVGVTVPGYAQNIFGQTSAATVAGTGVVLSGDGYILTNFHVIEPAYEKGTVIRILTYDGDEYDASVVGVESDSDLCVLKIEASDLTPAVLGDSEEMRVGQTIYTVGNPLGELTYTMTSGIISALDRRITTDVNVTVNMFQIDAAVNNGNSGGPVFNDRGQVIGIVTAKYDLSGMEGLGFAIPVNDACRIASDLVGKGYVTGKAYLGLQLANVSPSVARYYDMVQGVYVYSVEEGSCAEAAGIVSGDIIVAIDGKSVATAKELAQAVREYRAGDSAELTVWRGDIVTVTVVFDEDLPAGQSSEEPTREPARSRN